MADSAAPNICIVRLLHLHTSSRRRIPLFSLSHTQRARPNDDGTISDLILSIVVSLKRLVAAPNSDGNNNAR